MDNLNELWLWFDAETTGLLGEDPILLEAGWMVTTPDLRQLTPLRNAYCVLDAAETWLAPEAKLRELTWPEKRLSKVTAEMHKQSGLEDDWRHSAVEGTVIRDPEDLDYQINIDVCSASRLAGFEDPFVIRLAGAGVSHFDVELLRSVGSAIPEWCHYRTADTSVAAMVARITKLTEVDHGDGLMNTSPVTSSDASLNPHRAVADIRAAWATARLIQFHTTDQVAW